MRTAITRTGRGEWSYWFVSGTGCLFGLLPCHEDDPRLVRYDDWTVLPA
ncbi:hypothetical protein ABZY10_20735 [Streptomyces sp. NPDC006539]